MKIVIYFWDFLSLRLE